MSPSSFTVGRSRRLRSLLVLNALALAPALLAADGEGREKIGEIVVTASGIQEGIADVPQSISVFDQKKLALEVPRSAVDFLSENSLGFAAPIAPGHSFLSIRGAITNQIGYDDSSEIAVLLNGRRAGTDNLSKLAPIDAYSIEVLRGPSSVIYGSSAIGGVINLITKNGLNSPGSRFTGIAGSFDRYTAGFESGGKSGAYDYYVGVQYQTSGDYKTGENSPGDGTLKNTSYTRRTGNVTLGYALSTNTRASLVLRSDGLYDVGHRGITYSFTDKDDRFNNSAELKLEGTVAASGISWAAHSYLSQDVEVWYWSQDPLLFPFSNALLGNRPGITKDVNTRHNTVLGERLSASFSLGSDNTLLTGLDLEYTRLRSHREREAAAGYVEGWQPFPTTQPNVRTSPVNIAPLHYNYDSKVFAPYIEDTQRLFNDRLVLKAGARFDTRTQALRRSPYESATIDTRSRSFDAVTFRLGSTYKLSEDLSLKASIGSGFRAPNPNELSGESFSGNGVKSVGNPNLKNETSLGWELGAVARHGAFSGEVTYFDSDIKDRITAYVNAAATAAYGYTTTIASNINHAITRGVEVRLAYDLGAHLGSGEYKIEPFISGTNHFIFEVRDPVYNAINNEKHIQRVNRYQGTIGLRTAKKQLWDLDLNAVFSGPTYESGGTHGLADANYPINPTTGARITSWIFKKDSYWLLNTRFGYQVNERLRLFGGANNLLDRNYDPSFLALNQVNYKYTVNPYKSQSRGTTGSSSPGRELFAGIQYSF